MHDLVIRGGTVVDGTGGPSKTADVAVDDGIITELSLFVATDAPVKFVRLKITNRSDRQRQLSVTGYWEWVLGELRDRTLMHVVTELDPVCGALFARNPRHRGLDL